MASEFDLTIKNLISAASLYARQTLDGPGVRYMPAEEAFIALSGIVLDRLAKAALMKRNPILIIDANAGVWDSLLHLTGFSDHKKLRTASLTVSLKRLTDEPFRVKLGVTPDEVKNLVELRNQSAHGLGSQDGSTLVDSYVTIVDSLLVDLDVDRSFFWGECLQAADYAKGKAEAVARDGVKDLITRARANYDRLTPRGSDEDNRRAYEWSRRKALSVAEWRQRDCPACGNVGVMDGHLFRSHIDVPEDQSDTLVVIQFDPSSFTCTSCPLVLSNEVEVEYGMGRVPAWTDLSEAEYERVKGKADWLDVTEDQ
ncbi:MULTISPECIES: hypothetical protein [Streptomyces]|uniref:hypothetical protein n=1 Tax=Streptomyces TaxID=1883 RepID=UPI0012FEBB00|nr:hypothetical protein [Streptomyces sp. JS01]